MKISSTPPPIPKIEPTPMPPEVRRRRNEAPPLEKRDSPPADKPMSRRDIYEAGLATDEWLEALEQRKQERMEARAQHSGTEPSPLPPLELPPDALDASPLPAEEMPPMVDAEAEGPAKFTSPPSIEPPDEADNPMPKLHPGRYYRHFADAAREAQEQRILRFEDSGKLAKFAEHAARHPHAERYEQLLAFRERSGDVPEAGMDLPPTTTTREDPPQTESPL